MQPMLRRSSLWWLLPLLCSCSAEVLSPVEPEPDGGVADDATFDAGVSPDATAEFDAAPTDLGVAPDAAEVDAGFEPDAAEPPDSGPRTTPLHPLVLVHGWAAGAEVLGMQAIADDLSSRGHRVYVATVAPFDAIAVRAAQLAGQVDTVLRDHRAAKVNVIAHSMGGLDTRHLISTLGYGDRVASLSTISTPHRGSAIADVVLGLQAGASTAAIDALAAIYGRRISDAGTDPNVRASLHALSESAAPAFNLANPDDPRVYYQSWAGLSNVGGIASRNDVSACQGLLLFDPRVRDVMDPVLVGTAVFVAHGLRVLPNDGMVTVDSALWGRFRGCIAADHADEVGAFDDVPPDPRTGFDYLLHYRTLVEELIVLGY